MPVETERELEETLRRLSRLLGGSETKQWRKRVDKCADQMAAGKRSAAAEILRMYQGGMGSFLDLQGADPLAHEQLNALRGRAYCLAEELVNQSAKLGT